MPYSLENGTSIAYVVKKNQETHRLIDHIEGHIEKSYVPYVLFCLKLITDDQFPGFTAIGCFDVH